MITDEECRKEFEALCRFMHVEFSLEWDKAGFYEQLEASRSYTWFKLGFDVTKARALLLDAHATPPLIDEFHLAMAGESKLPTYAFPITTDEAQAFNDLAPLACAARSEGFRVAIADLEPQKNSKEI